MKYLVTGVNGQLGYDLVKELENKKNAEIVKTDREMMDITDQAQVEKVIAQDNPDIDVIFHCAAYTSVDKAENEQELCQKINVEGTKKLVAIAKKINAKFVYISTDYVFDGEKDGIYEIEDMTNPQSIYGSTKLQGEIEARKLEKHFIVRISWVFGKNGKNFIKTMLRLAEEKEEISVVDDQVGSPTYTKDLAKLLVNIVETEHYGTYHATNEGYCSWADLAEFIIQTTGKSTVIKRITSEEYPQKAKRPKNSKMSKSKLTQKGFETLPNWKDAIQRFLEELEENREDHEF